MLASVIGGPGFSRATIPVALQSHLVGRLVLAEADVNRVEPKLVAEITYLTWTADNLLGTASRRCGPARGFCRPFINALGRIVERRNSGVPQREGLKMSDWRIRHKDAGGRDAQATLLCREAAIVQALFLERRQRCRVQIIEGPDGELIDGETFEREHLKAALVITPRPFETVFQAQLRP
jgi:hypothetical protein